jgi:hypothetical protein
MSFFIRARLKDNSAPVIFVYEVETRVGLAGDRCHVLLIQLIYVHHAVGLSASTFSLHIVVIH